MRKIYFEEADSSSLILLIKSFFSDGTRMRYAAVTYEDSKFTIKEPYWRRRSFEDLLIIANTYIDNVSEEDLMAALIYNDIKFYYCSDVRKIVFFGGASHFIDGVFEVHYSHDIKYAEDTYTLTQLKSIYTNLKTK